ncbi:MAG: phosphoglucosamine mutase [Negativicutes bacterium]|nr:phosphoglucosamine mutase [Negativicutes bacterium]
MARLFGTDGVRGIANTILTPELAFQLGRAAAAVLTPQQEKPTILVGKDPRSSGEMLEAALAAGMMSNGAQVISLGIVTTPAVAYLTKQMAVQAGAMISASHNQVEDNGIKFFSHDGYKLPDRTEDAIEAYLCRDQDVSLRPTGAAVGSWQRNDTAIQLYLHHLRQSIAGIRLDGLHIVLDCANGASAPLAADLFRSVGAKITTLHAKPNGANINLDCGSTHPASLQKAVKQMGADFGFAFDGDADRCLAVDADGNLVDGDQIMAMLALHLKQKGSLKKNTLVITVMSNLGLKKAMAEHQIELQITAVGDRYVLETMLAKGYNLGGEQSGHIILTDFSTTGDGMLTGLQIAAMLKESKATMREKAEVLHKFPQVLLNCKVEDKQAAMRNTVFSQAVAEETAALGERGRILVRSSGTEQLIRIMVEA